MKIVDYTQENMQEVTSINWPTRPYLALADKICLGMAVALNRPVITADKILPKLGLPVEIHVIR